MRIYRRGITICFLFALVSCQHAGSNGDRQSVRDALLHCSAEFHAKSVSYLIAEKGQIKYEREEEASTALELSSTRAILAHFMAPLVLDRMIRDSLVHGQDSVSNWLKVKDLIAVPASYYYQDTGKPHSITGRILDLIHKNQRPSGYSMSGIPGQLITHSDPDIHDLFHDLWRISDYFDNTYPEYAFAGNTITNAYPSWYTSGLSSFFGWNILKFQGQTVLWTCDTVGPSTILLIKSIDKQVFAALAYPTEAFPSPGYLNSNDLLQSPLAITLLRTLYQPNTSIDYTQPAEAVYARLEKCGESSYNFIHLHDLQAHARLYERTGMRDQAAALYRMQGRLMKDSLLVQYENQPLLASINYVSDNLTATVPFSLKTQAAVQIFAGGQVRIPHDYSGDTYQFDNVQLFLNDHAGEKTNSWFNTRLFQFNYGSDKVRISDGQCAIRDASDTSYLVEVRIAWTTLNNVKHRAGRNLLANVLIGVCDLEETQRKSVLSWSVGPTENYADEKKYGQIRLSLHPGKNDGRTLYALQTPIPPLIDGKADSVWFRAPWSPVTRLYMGSTGPSDNAGQFKALYDDQYLYLLFDVTDNCKNRLYLVTEDKCWIENAVTGLPVWKMNADTTSSYPSFSDSRRISLPAGKYLLKYISDKGHSYEHWYGPPPANGIYGASVYLAEKK